MYNLQEIYGTKSEETIIKWDDVNRKLVKQCCKEVTQGISWTSDQHSGLGTNNYSPVWWE